MLGRGFPLRPKSATAQSTDSAHWSSSMGQPKTRSRPRSALAQPADAAASHRIALASQTSCVPFGGSQPIPGVGVDTPAVPPALETTHVTDKQSTLRAHGSTEAAEAPHRDDPLPATTSSSLRNGGLSPLNGLPLRVKSRLVSLHGTRGIEFISLPTEEGRQGGKPSRLMATGDGSRGAAVRRANALALDIRLKEDLAHIPIENKIARLAAHRSVFTEYIDGLDDSSAQSLLRSVLGAYDELQYEGFEIELKGLVARVRASEAREAAARATINKIKLQASALQLDLENAQRRLSQKNEILSHIANVYGIPIAQTHLTDGNDEHVLTLTDIQLKQSRMEQKYQVPRPVTDAPSPAQSAGFDDPIVVSGHSPRRPCLVSPPVVAEAQATETTTPPTRTHLEIFRRCLEMDSVCVDLEKGMNEEAPAD